MFYLFIYFACYSFYSRFSLKFIYSAFIYFSISSINIFARLFTSLFKAILRFDFAIYFNYIFSLLGHHSKHPETKERRFVDGGRFLSANVIALSTKHVCHCGRGANHISKLLHLLPFLYRVSSYSAILFRTPGDKRAKIPRSKLSAFKMAFRQTSKNECEHKEKENMGYSSKKIL